MPVSESMPAGASPPAETEMDSKIDFLKRHRAAGPYGLSPSFFQDGGEVLTFALPKPASLLKKEKDP